MSLFPSSWRKEIVKQEDKRAKKSYTANVMVPSTAHRKIKELVRKNVTANTVFQSLHKALLVTVDTEREWKLVQRLKKFSADGHTLNLQHVPRRMTTDEVCKFVGEELRKEYKAHHQGRAVALAGCGCIMEGNAHGI